MEPNLFPASGDDRDRFRIYSEKHIQSLVDDEMETEKLIHDSNILDIPIKKIKVRYQLEIWRVISTLENGKLKIYRFGITKIVNESETKTIKK